MYSWVVEELADCQESCRSDCVSTFFGVQRASEAFLDFSKEIPDGRILIVTSI